LAILKMAIWPNQFGLNNCPLKEKD
jgi:hypothetical protein